MLSRRHKHGSEMGKKKQREAQGAAAEWLLAQLRAGNARSKTLNPKPFTGLSRPRPGLELQVRFKQCESESASLTSWTSEAWGAPKDLAVTLRNKSSNPEFVRRMMGEVLQGSHDAEQKYSELCTPSGSQNGSKNGSNKRKRMQAFGQSFQC